MQNENINLEINPQNQKPYQTKANCMLVFEHDERLSGVIAYNELLDKKVIMGSTPWERNGTEITDVDMQHIYLIFEEYGLTVEHNIDAALTIYAYRHKFHPIKTYLESLEWDGVPRLRFALHHYLGADTSDFTYECLKLFMLGAIERTYHPGCKFEYVLCLIGEQGNGKSTFLRFLAIEDDFFTDSLGNLSDPNVYRYLQGHFIVEFPEMIATNNAKHIEEIKAFMSRQKDTYKVPYEKYPQDRLRRCVFCGTSNKMDFLPFDRTGNRRFLPILTRKNNAEVHILEDEAESRAYIKQMWAEVMQIYKSGEYKLKLTEEMEHYANDVRSQFMLEDTDAGMIKAFLDDYKSNEVCALLIAYEAMHIEGKADRRIIMEINDIMNNTITGWKKSGDTTKRFPNYGTQRYWEREKTETDFISVTEDDIIPFEQQGLDV